MYKYILFFDEHGDVSVVGGKNASLMKLTRMGLPVPEGFAIKSNAYQNFIEPHKKKINELLKNTGNVKELEKASKSIMDIIVKSKFPQDIADEVFQAFDQLKKKSNATHVAVRSSGTYEDMQDASFAGQYESFLNVSKRQLMDKVKRCFASLFTARAISYRNDKGFSHDKVLLSVGVQKQIFSKSSGVMFTIEPDSGHGGFIYINGIWGMGDYIVQGKVTPDEFLVFKKKTTIIEKKLGDKKIMETRSRLGVRRRGVPSAMKRRYSLSDDDITNLAKYGMMIEEHYKVFMDIEWAKDERGLYIIQARPETIHIKERKAYDEYKLLEKSKVILKGIGVGRKISSGNASIIKDPKDIRKLKKGDILVTSVTDPDWEPVMKMSSGIVTERGGRTAHAAIISRELGIPCVVGAEGAMKKLKNKTITIDCSSGEGIVWERKLKYRIYNRKIVTKKTKTKIYVNIANPDMALDVSQMPVDGVGLAREEFIINEYIGEHPMHMIASGRQSEYTERLSYGIGKIAASFYPKPVVVRFSDFKTNEYANLKGGQAYEPKEENPMIGWRGVSRYVNEGFEPAFRLECRAIKNVIEKMGMDNIKLMLPFVRTVDDVKSCSSIIKTEGLSKNDLWIMIEVPSTAFNIEAFCKSGIDGVSLGTNDLTQLILGTDRDSELLERYFNEEDPAVLAAIRHIIKNCKKHKISISCCGQAPSDKPGFAKFLVNCGIDSISVNPDSIITARENVKKFERSRHEYKSG